MLFFRIAMLVVCEFSAQSIASTTLSLHTSNLVTPPPPSPSTRPPQSRQPPPLSSRPPDLISVQKIPMITSLPPTPTSTNRTAPCVSVDLSCTLQEVPTGSHGIPDRCCPEQITLQSEGTTNWLLLFAASFNALLAVASLLLNLFIVTYYWNNSNTLSSTLYLRNGIADSTSTIGFLVQVPLIIRVLEEDLPSSITLISYWITTVSVRMSVFMNCVLSVARCINILSPFHLISRTCVNISTLIYLLLWSTIASLDVCTYTLKVGIQNKVYLIKSLVLKAEPGFSLSSLTGSVNKTLTSFSQGEAVAIQFLAPIALPATLCFILMLLQIYHLTMQVSFISHRPRPGTGGEKTSKNNVSSEELETGRRIKNHSLRAAVTILIVTTVYVLTSICTVAAWLLVYRTHLGKEDKIKKLSWMELSVIYICSSTSHLLCSTVTALTLLLRSTKLQRYLKETGIKTITSITVPRNSH